MAFLAFEGLDGSGKSTLIARVRSEFERRGIAFIATREPGGTELGDEIRQLLLRVKGETPVQRAEALLYQAGRAQHVETVICPALANEKWVLCDRYAASSLAFQAGGRAIDSNRIEWLNEFSTGGLKPDLYILMDLSVEESARRLKGRAGDTDRFERELHEFHERVRQEYLRLARSEPEQWIVLDAMDSTERMWQKLLAVLVERRWLA